ncbi:hypothetical protein DFH06DRAFT_1338852 [Mycena polygramma]|nr:hypothetical protein DFH06DRAFT_1338852 [Mycena polygramma]
MDPEEHRGFVVRPFRPADTPQIHALLLEGLLYGPDSPCTIALHRNLNTRISYLTYAGLSLGILAILISRSSVTRLTGVLLCAISLALFFSIRRSITNMFLDVCATARGTDLADIAAFYGVPLPEDRAQIPRRAGRGGFWVAAIELPYEQHKSSEVIGCLGLAGYIDASTDELRRMFVGMHHRRRGVATQLLRTALNHARRFGPPLETLELETSEFQIGARRLYGKHGFSVIETRAMGMGIMSKMLMLRFRLDHPVAKERASVFPSHRE